MPSMGKHLYKEYKAQYSRLPFAKMWLRTVDLFGLSLDQILLYIEYIIYFFNKTSYLNEEINCTEPAPSVSIP